MENHALSDGPVGMGKNGGREMRPSPCTASLRVAGEGGENETGGRQGAGGGHGGTKPGGWGMEGQK